MVQIDSSFGQLSHHIRSESLYLLDGECVTIDGLRIGGIGLISGNPEKRLRRLEEDQVAMIQLVAEQGVDILILHEGPCGNDLNPATP